MMAVTAARAFSADLLNFFPNGALLEEYVASPEDGFNHWCDMEGLVQTTAQQQNTSSNASALPSLTSQEEDTSKVTGLNDGTRRTRPGTRAAVANCQQVESASDTSDTSHNAVKPLSGDAKVASEMEYAHMNRVFTGAGSLEIDALERRGSSCRPRCSSMSEDTTPQPRTLAGKSPLKRKGPATAPLGKDKKKVGRPISYRGSPNSPTLTEEDKRRIRRRIANRESARRVRQKREEMLQESQEQMLTVQQQNGELLKHISKIEGEKSLMSGALGQMQQRWSAVVHENEELHKQVMALRQSLEANWQMSAAPVSDEHLAQGFHAPSFNYSAPQAEAPQMLPACSGVLPPDFAAMQASSPPSVVTGSPAPPPSPATVTPTAFRPGVTVTSAQGHLGQHHAPSALPTTVTSGGEAARRLQPTSTAAPATALPTARVDSLDMSDPFLKN